MEPACQSADPCFCLNVCCSRVLRFEPGWWESVAKPATGGRVPISCLGKLYFESWSDKLSVLVLKPLTALQEEHVRRVEQAQLFGNMEAAGVTGEDRVDGAWFLISYARHERFINFHGPTDAVYSHPIVQLNVCHVIQY